MGIHATHGMQEVWGSNPHSSMSCSADIIRTNPTRSGPSIAHLFGTILPDCPAQMRRSMASMRSPERSVCPLAMKASAHHRTFNPTQVRSTFSIPRSGGSQPGSQELAAPRRDAPGTRSRHAHHRRRTWLPANVRSALRCSQPKAGGGAHRAHRRPVSRAVQEPPRDIGPRTRRVILLMVGWHLW